jgi:hypothetical protein
MSIGQPFTTHSTSSTMDSDDNINSHVKINYKLQYIYLFFFLAKFNLFK